MILPKTLEPHIGLEIEFDLPGFDPITMLDRRFLTNTTIPQASEKHWINKESLSARRTPISGYELKLLGTSKTLMNDLEPLLKSIKENNGFVDEHCGMHVHIDCRKEIAPENEQKNFTTIVYDKLFKSIKDIYAKCAPYRAGQCYSRMPHAPQLTSVKKYGLEVSAKGTVEVRARESTLDIDKIRDYINLLLKITDRELLS